MNTIEKLSEMIKLKTVSHYDSENDFPEFRKLLKKLYPSLFKIAHVEVFDGSLLIKWDGKESLNPVLFMNHHDVVEAEGNWSHNPFGGEVFDNKLYGRGSLDTKGGLACMLEAAEELINEGFIPNSDIYFESASCEETTGFGAKEIAKELLQKGIHFKYVLDEGGMIMYDPIGGADATFAMVGMGEKRCSNLEFIARSNGGHASTPAKNTPVARIAKFVNEVENSNIFKSYMNETTIKMFEVVGPTMKGISKFLLSKPRIFKPLLTLIIPKLSPTTNAMFKSTIAFTTLSGSKSINAIPEEVVLGGNLRFSHHDGQDKCLKALKEIAKKYDIEMRVIDYGDESSITSCDSDSYKLLDKAIQVNFDNVITCPYICNGASDSRFMCAVSDEVLRFVPFIINEQQLESIHGIDECVDIDNIDRAVKFYKTMMKGA